MNQYERFSDNYYKGLMAEIEKSIEDCNDPEILRRMGTALKYILGGRALNKRQDLLNGKIH